eukprot:SAG31_NODE_17389_length_672_cov_1.345550_2_plen_80_part_01
MGGSASSGFEVDANWFIHESVEQRYSLHKVVGVGAYGRVYLAADKASGEHVAVKMVAESALKSAAEAQCLLAECELLRKH